MLRVQPYKDKKDKKKKRKEKKKKKKDSMHVNYKYPPLFKFVLPHFTFTDNLR